MDCMRDNFKEGVVLDGRFETISALNHGSFGMVFMAKDLVTEENVALKCLTKTTETNGCPSTFAVDERSEELTAHIRIGSHPNIVNLIHSFETKNHIYLVLELCPNGDLYEAIRLGRGPLETEHVRDFMYELVGAVEYLHSKGIYHRDIKPENIFLTQDGKMKLGDFGLSTSDEWSYESAVGSDRYMAPEQYDPSDSGYSPAKADIWAIGICLLNVLFSRNPFAVPAFSDPLFADFAGDRQTLFDVFPNMSQDTFGVLVHCLAIDPNKRSLSAVREALDRVISFTTDDESLDEFCVEDREVVGATANREPLRTPSVTTPQVGPDGAFPWAKALAMTPPQPVRQLSAIPDVDTFSEDLFASSERADQDWCSVRPDNASVISFVDSGLGVSLTSTNTTQARARPISSRTSRPVPIPGSLPARPLPSMASVFGKKADFVSKSWSDLWDEEEEENSESENIASASITKLGFRERVLSHETGSGRTTPRAGLSEAKDPGNANNRNRSPCAVAVVAVPSDDDRVSEQTGFIFEDHPQSIPRYSPPKKRSFTDKLERFDTKMDKWAMLGDRRRGQPSPDKEKASMPLPAPGFPRKRSRASSWKRGNGNQGWGPFSHPNDSGFLAGKESGSGVAKSLHHNGSGNGNSGNGNGWSLSKDWRQHVVSSSSSTCSPATTVASPSSGRHPYPQQLLQHHQPDGEDDIGDLEWVGGWHDLHL